MDLLEKAIAMISAASGADASSVAERLNTDATPDALASELFEPKYKAQRDQGHNTGVDKTFRKISQALKAAGAEDVTLDTLSDAIAAVQSKAAAANPAALTPEQLLRQKPVVDALNAAKLATDNAVAAARQEERGLLAKDRQAFDKQRTDAAVRDEIRAQLNKDGKTPNYTPGREAVQEERLIDEIMRDGHYMLDDKGKPQLVDAEGVVLPGKMGLGVKTIADFVFEKAEVVHGWPVSSPRESAGLTAEDIAAGKNKPVFVHFKGEMPKTEAELTAIRADQDIPLAARQEVKAAWEAAHPPQ